MININDFWDKTAYPNNTSQAITDAISSQSRPTLYFPDGVYYVENVSIPDDTRIIAEQNAIVRGVTEQSDMFILNGSRIRVGGGRWRSCHSVFLDSGIKATTNNVFSQMFIEHADIPFSLKTCHNNSWQNCIFDHTGQGIWFEPGLNSSVNSVIDCRFDCNDISIQIDKGNKNLIQGCWFENCDDIAIKLNDAQNTTIANSWFENNGGLDMPDIVIEGNSKQTTIDCNRFGEGNNTQSERIKLSGESNILANNNYVYLKAEQVFARVEATKYMTHLLQTNISAPSGGYYVDRLFLRLSIHPILYDIFVDSNTLGADSYGEFIV